MSVGGVAVFPADTVYGLACDPGNRVAVERLYRLKRRALDKPSAVMFFDRSLALEALPELGERTRAALERLLPGPVSVLVPNPARRYPLACGADPTTLGLRVVEVGALEGVRGPVLQSSANFAGGPDPRALGEVPAEIRRACEMVVDGGELPGTPSTVVDLREFEADGAWTIVRRGGFSEASVSAAMSETEHDDDPDDETDRYRFDPAGYADMIRADIPGYEEMHDVLGAAARIGARRMLELGTGTGETAQRLLDANPQASLVGLDENEAMLSAAAARLPAERVSLRVGRIEDPLPDGEFDLVASSLCVHHLDGAGKRELFSRVRDGLVPGGRFVLADVVVPEDPADALTELTPGYDMPDRVADQLEWLTQARFTATVAWSQRDLAVVVAQAL
jgi:tRNA threonylcarbamoyl adenosine modification protein (Sua5/YciO/YrdC/YwlC family)